MKSLRSRLRRLVFSLSLLVVAVPVFAQDGLLLGTSLHYADALVLDANATLPFFETKDVQHAVRADVSYAFEGAPGVSASYLLSGAPDEDALTRYLGAGFGLAFPAAPVSSPLVSAHGLVGLRVPLTSHLHAYGETLVAGNAFDIGMSFGIGVGYAFGGTQ